MVKNKSITVQADINADVTDVWKAWNEPKDIVNWNYASDDWYCPNAKNDLKANGKFSFTMSAKDKSASFDFEGEYTKVDLNKLIEYIILDGRKVRVQFIEKENATNVIETFDMEEINSEEMQRNGWQSILNNFKKYVEGKNR